MREMQREAERARREAERAAKEAAKEAERARREAERQQREAQREAQRAAQEAARQQREAERAAKEAAKEAARAAKEAQRAAQEAEKAAAKAAEQAAKEASKAAKEAAKEAAKAAKEAAKAAKEQAKEAAKKAKEADKTAKDEKSDDQKSDGDSDKQADTDKTEKTEKVEPVGPTKQPVVIDQPPPKTVTEMFNRLFSGSKKETDGNSSDDSKSDTGGTDTPAPTPATPSVAPKAPGAAVKPVGRTSGTGGVVRAEMDFPSLGARELLATNLDRPSLDKLVGLGFSARGERGFGLINMTVTRLVPPSGMSAEQATAIFKQTLPDQSIAQNRIYRPYAFAAKPDDAHPDAIVPASDKPCPPEKCFGFSAVNWSDAHRTCAREFPIGVIDTPADIAHPAFRRQQISVGTFTSGGKRLADTTHGTGVLALLAGRRDGGTPGLLPDAHYFMADVFFADAKGHPMTDTVSLLKALEWLDASGVRVINMSVSGPRDDLVGLAIAKLSARGVIVTAAAGNGGMTAPPSYPAAYPQVISVTAVSRDGRVYRHANQGRYIDLAAPGVKVWTAYPGAREGEQTGTSFAVPYATAAVAAVYDRLQEHSKAGVLRTMAVTDAGAAGQDPIYGRGVLQAPTAQCAPSPGVVSAATTTTGSTSSEPIEVLPWAVPAAGVGLGFAPSGN